MEETTAQAVELVINSGQYASILASLGFIAAILTLFCSVFISIGDHMVDATAFFTGYFFGLKIFMIVWLLLIVIRWGSDFFNH